MWQKFRVHAALFTVNLIYGANYTVAKEVMPEYIQPFGFILLRASGATLLFWLVKLLLSKEKVQKQDWPRLIFCGIFGVATNQLFFFKGLSITTPINASLMMIMTPILVLLISAIAGSEGLSFKKALGVGCGAFGALLIAGGTDFSFSSSTWLGDLFILLNAISYGIYLVLVKPLMKRYQPLTVITWVFTFGFVPVLFIGYPQFLEIEWQTFTAEIWLAVVFVVLAVTFFAYLLNIFALKEVPPSVVGIYIYLQPVLATLIALSVGRDELTRLKLIAALFIFMGVYLVSRPTVSPKIETA